jgi:hypothetical protein
VTNQEDFGVGENEQDKDELEDKSDMQEFDVNIEPDASALRIFRNMSFTPWYALGEFIDNSITSALIRHKKLLELNGKDYELKITISFPPGENSLVVEDNAAGIARQDMRRALKTGAPPKDTSIGLSKHGVGLKAASLWWGEHIIIDTYPIDEVNGWHVEIDVSEKGEVSSIVKVTKIPHRGFSGTRIEVRGLWQKTPQSKTITSIKAYLPSIYRAFIGENKIEGQLKCLILYQGKPLSFKYPKLLTEPLWTSTSGPGEGESSRYWHKEISIKLATGKSINGWVGILDRMSRDLSGLFLHYRSKGIAGVVPLSADPNEDQAEAKDAISRGSYKPRRIFKQQGSYPDQSFIGEFDITIFGKTITTDSPLWTPDEENEFIDKLFNTMSDDDFIRMATNYRRNKASVVDEIANKNSDKLEAEIVQEALENKVDHEDIQTSEEDIERLKKILKVDDVEEIMSVPIPDKEGHTHHFKVIFVKDVSRDFLLITENEFEHEIQINIFHPSLSGIIMDASGRKILQRLCIAFAAGEVFSTGYDKSRLRNKANYILSQLGMIIKE